MSLSKGKIILAGAVAVCLVGGGVFMFSHNSNDSVDTPLVLKEVQDDTDNIDDSVTEKEDAIELHEVQESDAQVADKKNFKYDPFAEDAGWGDESIFGNHMIINGTGKKEESQGGLVIVDDSEQDSTAKKNTRALSSAEAQAAMMEEVKSNNYTYRINERSYSDGFGIYRNPKYELGVSRIMGDTGYISGPNDTEVGITELDNSVSLDEHRKKVLTDSGYGAVYRLSKGAAFEYNTPVTIGSGIDDFKNTSLYNLWRCKDLSVNNYGGQLFCDTEMKSSFGSGYYIELYNATSGLYYGYYIVEHNGRIFKATGKSMYRDTLLDVTLATIDTCVYPY